MNLGVSITNAEFELLLKFDAGITVTEAYSRMAEQNDRPPRLATLYTMFSALRSKGMIVEAGARRDGEGRPSKVFVMTPIGQMALALYHAILAWRSTQIAGA